MCDKLHDFSSFSLACVFENSIFDSCVSTDRTGTSAPALAEAVSATVEASTRVLVESFYNLRFFSCFLSFSPGSLDSSLESHPVFATRRQRCQDKNEDASMDAEAGSPRRSLLESGT